MGMGRGLVLALLLATAGCASGGHGHTHGDSQVVPTHEKDHAQHLVLKGPKKTQGIAAVVNLASLVLAREFKELQGRQLRVRELTIAPGGVVAVHQHQRRPGVAYIIEGEMVEHRSGAKAPIVHKAGSVAVEYTGVSHWWENASSRPARALVIDIVPLTPSKTK